MRIAQPCAELNIRSIFPSSAVFASHRNRIRKEEEEESADRGEW